MPSPPLAPPPDDAELRRLAGELGKTAARFLGLAIEERHADLASASADILVILQSLWSRRDIAPDEIWIELDHRLQLGELLLRLQQDARRLPRRGKGVWHPGSTKLP